MSSANGKELPVIKPSYPRYITIDENIHAALSLYALSLYMAFRYEADYRNEDSEIKRSAKYLYTKAKISRPQYYRCLLELEACGLVLRDKENKLGETCTFHVARELGYFSKQIETVDKGVSEIDTGVSTRDTDHYSLSLSSINTANSSKQQGNQLLRELIEVYRQEFPDNPQPHKTLISTSLEKVLRALVKRWPEADPDRKPLTPEVFRRYMRGLKTLCPKFALGEYETPSGNRKKNGLETFARWNTLVKFLENQYS